MKLSSSYSVEIEHINKLFRQTVSVYRKALSFLIDTYEKEWEYLSAISQKLKRFNTAEHLIHNTKNNTAKYDFDSRFYKVPSYLRRDLINTALGILSSYHSNLETWENSGKIGEKPTLQKNHYSMPVFFKENMYLETDSDTTCKLKVLKDHDWI